MSSNALFSELTDNCLPSLLPPRDLLWKASLEARYRVYLQTVDDDHLCDGFRRHV